MEKSTGMILAHAGEEYDQYYNAIVPPIFMNSLNIFPTVDAYYDSDKRDRAHVLLWQGSESNRTDSRRRRSMN